MAGGSETRIVFIRRSLADRSEQSCKQKFLPECAAREFPDRWRKHLRENYRSHIDVARTFRVSEAAARKWWDGVGAANGRNVAAAVEINPVAALSDLFGIAAE